MAKQRGPQNTGEINPHSFEGKLVEDTKGLASKPNTWTQARNATVNTVEGDLGELSNEQANKFCVAAPYKIIGVIHIDEDKWAIFSTDETNAEIGLFEDGLCRYTTIVNDQCLNFSELHLIKGQAKENFDCTFQLYWDDGNNPTRTLNIEDVPYIENCIDENGQPVPNPGNPAYVSVGCLTCVSTGALDCDAIRLAPLITNPCFEVQKGPQGGELENGSYFVVGAYLINDQKISDYSLPSNVQALFDHGGIAGSLEIIIDDMDPRFDEFELVVVQIRNLKTLAKRIGVYNTRQQRISIDIIDERYVTVPLNLIPLRNPIADKSDAIYRNGDYMLRVGPTDKFDFNYQPLANQINTEWVSVEYDPDYYRKGGNKTNYLRDEVYSFFIRWVYDTGDKSVSYHIPGRYEPGRGPGAGGLNGTGVFASDASADALPDEITGGFNTKWLVENTANMGTSLYPTAITLPDGGVQIGKGQMAYWESSERYDDDNPDVWDASSDPIWGSTAPAHDLCGKYIRHHRFPDNTKGYANGAWTTNHYNSNGSKIRVMGVQFNNIKPPLNNDGTPITNIVGYEILRGTREGNKSIAAKGMINNMREYAIPGSTTTRRGLYPNYPYNPTKDLAQNDKFLSYGANGKPGQGNPFVNHRLFTFHSPDTTFKDPFLSAKELHIYGELRGDAEGRFEEPDGHPQHKLITNFTFFIGLVAGIAYATIKKNGSRTTTKREPQYNWIQQKGSGQLLGGYGTGYWTMEAPALSSTAGATLSPSYTGIELLVGANSLANDALIAADKQTGEDVKDGIIGSGPRTWFSNINTKNDDMADDAMSLSGPMLGGFTEESSIGGDNRQMPTILNIMGLAMTFGIAVSEGANVAFDLIKKLSPSQQYALQVISHCFYNEFAVHKVGMIRFGINDAVYLDPNLQDFGTNWRINNLYRGRTVALETQRWVDDCVETDDTQQTVGTSGVGYKDPKKSAFKERAASHYVGLKQRLRNQYGQIEGIVQVPVTTCMTPIAQTTSDVEFGGDTYVGRYTEKNTMHFFYNWLNGQPDYAELDYQDYQMVDHPIYWMDTYEYDFNEFMNQLMTLAFITSPSGFTIPTDKHRLDGSAGIMIKKESYMYLFNSGVRDFFVESEVNVDLRDWGEEDSERHYDPYGWSDTSLMFNTALIKSGNFFKYDYSLSVSRLYSNYVHWGNTHQRRYNPLIAEDCFVYRPNRVIYSLRQNLENTKDYWKVFLPNNYKDFKSRVTAVKPIGDNGAMMLFENESPVQIKSVDVLTTDGGTKLTIGDGGLFSQPLQNVLNTDDSYEYGSCQNRLSVINTASGIFWMSQNQGKIFQIQNGIKEISAFDNKWWLATYLPYLLTKNPMFANNPFELIDNPVAGIGCQTIYDNQAQLIYFCKKDYFLRDDLVDTVTYVSGNDFLVNDALPIKLGDPNYFHDASWTISYNPKTQGWIGYHDWHPDLLIPGKTNFLSTLDDGIWRHNDNCQQYCNYYGIDYPFEVEYAVVTPQIVNTLRSVEYYMEVYKYDDNCYDRFHVLDFNFDEATIYNSEQCSGLLRLNISPKNNAPEIVTYPRINPTDIDVLYSKVEQKYRFNQFWDITADRGEFNAIAERMMFNTEANGYIRNLNPNNLDYNKFQTQRKKFRHYKNTVLLRRRVCGNRNMLVSLANNKNLKSPR